jgi:hypothetical protein
MLFIYRYRSNEATGIHGGVMKRKSGAGGEGGADNG